MNTAYSIEDTQWPTYVLCFFFLVPFVRILNAVCVFECHRTLSWYFNLQHIYHLSGCCLTELSTSSVVPTAMCPSIMDWEESDP